MIIVRAKSLHSQGVPLSQRQTKKRLPELPIAHCLLPIAY